MAEGARPERVIVAAVADNGVIGNGQALPWRLPGDLKRFRSLTVGRPVLMGRRTFEAIGRPLPDRTTIVVTSDAASVSGVATAPDLAAALALADREAAASGAGEVIVAGGAVLYRAALHLADRLEITRVHASPAGDVVFPPVDWTLFEETARQESPRSGRDEHAFTFHTFVRRR